MEALDDNTNPKSRESLEAQMQDNRTRVELLKKRKMVAKQKWEEEKRRYESREKQSSFDMSKLSHGLPPASDSNQTQLESEIYRVLEEHDSLLQFWMDNNTRDGKGDKQPETATPSTSSSLVNSYQSGSKLSKGDKTVIEELRMSNDQLRILVHQLLSELEKLQHEKQVLMKEIHEMKCDRLNQKYNQSSDQTSGSSSASSSGQHMIPQLPPLEPPKLLY